MKQWKKAAIAVAAGVMAAGILAGCGGEQKAPAAANGKTAVKTVISSTEPPLAWKDEKGAMHGYEYDVLEELNKRLKTYSLTIDAVPPETQDVMMESGEAKVAAGGYFKNAQREQNFLIPQNPIGASSLMVYVKKGEETKYKDLKEALAAGLKPAPLTPNGGAFRLLTEWNQKNGNVMKEIPVQSNMSQAERLRAIKEGQFDLLVVPNNLGIEDLAKKEGFEVATLAEPIKVNETVLLVNKQEQKLNDEINAALGEMRKDGTLAKISEKWYGSDLMKLLDKK